MYHVFDFYQKQEERRKKNIEQHQKDIAIHNINNRINTKNRYVEEDEMIHTKINFQYGEKYLIAYLNDKQYVDIKPYDNGFGYYSAQLHDHASNKYHKEIIDKMEKIVQYLFKESKKFNS